MGKFEFSVFVQERNLHKEKSEKRVKLFNKLQFENSRKISKICSAISVFAFIKNLRVDSCHVKLDCSHSVHTLQSVINWSYISKRYQPSTNNNSFSGVLPDIVANFKTSSNPYDKRKVCITANVKTTANAILTAKVIKN